MGFNRMIPPKRTGVDLSHIRVRARWFPLRGCERVDGETKCKGSTQAN